MTALVLRPPALPPVTQFDAYARAVNQLPMLSEEEETQLARKVQLEQNRDSALRLILSHLRLPVKVAREHRGYGLPLEDLTQEGNVGLMKAVKRFDPSRGARLATVALAWVRAEIRAYILKNWRLVKVATTKRLRHLFFTFRHEKQQLEQAGHHGGELDRLLAEKLNVTLSELHDVQLRLTGEQSIDTPLFSNNDQDPLTLADTLVISQDEQSLDNDSIAVVHEALETLPERTRKILKARYFQEPPVTLSTLSQELGVSVGRVAQIEAQGLSRMKQLTQLRLGMS